MNIGYILFPLALLQLGLGVSFIVRYRGNQATLWYGLFMIGVSFYVGANGLGYLHWLISQQQAEHLAWTGGAFTAAFIVPFSYSFPITQRSWRELLPWVLWPLVVFVPGILWTNAFVQQQSIVNFGNGYVTSSGPYFNVFLAFFMVYWVWAFTTFFRSLRRADGVHRRYLQIFLVGTILSIGISSFFDIYMPLTHATRFGYIGSLCSSIWFGFTSYILVRK